MGMNGIYPNNPLVSGQIGFGQYVPQPVYWQPQPMPMPQQPQAPHMEVCPVNGKEGALAFSIGPNSSVILPDSAQPKVWVLTTDATGTKAVKGFRIVEEEEEAPVAVEDPIAKLVERLTKLEERMELNNMASTSPEMAQVMAFIQQHNGDPMAALNDIARQKGVTPDYAMNKVKSML